MIPRDRFPVFDDAKTYRKLPGSKPESIHLIYPHTQEHPAVLPFGKALGEELMKRDIRIESHPTLDMMERGWRFTRALENEEVVAGVDLGCLGYSAQSVLSIEDKVARMRQIYKLADERHESLFLEIHAYRDPRFNINDNSFFGISDFFRIGGTRVLILRNALESFNAAIESLNTGVERIRFRDKNSDPMKIMRSIANVKGFDLDGYLEEWRDLCKKLKLLGREIRLIEIPGRLEALGKDHSMRDAYYSEKGVVRNGRSYFEMVYFAKTLQDIGFAPNDISAVADILVLTPEKIL